MIVVGAIGNDDGVVAQDFQARWPLDGRQAGDYTASRMDSIPGVYQGFQGGYRNSRVGALKIAQQGQ